MKTNSVSQHYCAQLLPRNQIDDLQWNLFIDNSPQGAIYAKTWYLDVVCNGWMGILVRYKNQLSAIMPLNISKKMWVKYSLKPAFCQYLGIFFKDKKLKRIEDFSFKKQIITAILNEIPTELKLFIHNFSPQFDYPLPFYWSGYELHLRYSYWLDVNNNKSEIYRAFSHRTKTCINKAIKNNLKVKRSLNINNLIELGRKYIKLSNHEYDILINLWSVLKKKNLGQIVEIWDQVDQIHCAVLYVKCRDKYIYLFGAVDAHLKNKDAIFRILDNIPNN